MATSSLPVRKRLFRAEHAPQIAVLFVLGLVCLITIYPFLWLIFSSFKTNKDIITPPIQLLPREWTTSAYRLVWTNANMPRAIANSLLVSGVIVLSVMFTSALGGFVFARLKFPGKNVLFIFILSTTMIPFMTLLIPLYLVMRELDVLDTYIAVVLPALISSFGIFLCRQFVYGIPGELFDAAKLDGAGDFRTFITIALPLMRPVLSALAIFTFLGAFNGYLWPLVVLNNPDLYTLPLVLAGLSGASGTVNYEAVMAGSVISTIPMLIVYLLFQRNFVRGVALSGIKG
ncbi:MAG: carbohydrate ABC transporter permease [Thermomicrobiales bacterium]|nr:carbohydrate ABC transporter permease [Thermomicrobiales bacterium]